MDDISRSVVPWQADCGQNADALPHTEGQDVSLDLTVEQVVAGMNRVEARDAQRLYICGTLKFETPR